MPILKEVFIDLDDFELEELIEYVKKYRYIFHSKSLTDSLKYEHLVMIINDYTLREIQDLLPKK